MHFEFGKGPTTNHTLLPTHTPQRYIYIYIFLHLKENGSTIIALIEASPFFSGFFFGGSSRRKNLNILCLPYLFFTRNEKKKKRKKKGPPRPVPFYSFNSINFWANKLIYSINPLCLVQGAPRFRYKLFRVELRACVRAEGGKKKVDESRFGAFLGLVHFCTYILHRELDKNYK